MSKVIDLLNKAIDEAGDLNDFPAHNQICQNLIRQAIAELSKQPEPEPEPAVEYGMCLACGDYISSGEQVYLGCIHLRCYWRNKKRPENPCPLCHGTGVMPNPEQSELPQFDDIIGLLKQPEPTEFAKDFRQWLADKKLSLGCAVWTKANKACTIIDRRAEELKEKDAEIKRLLEDINVNETKQIDLEEKLKQKEKA